ncbi:MAG: hypothetical protein LQ338_005234 [Usnochroma carphineum]|nr:MAG: hypothetical protein LQ338_005234 [Usnochroma carphineum]
MLVGNQAIIEQSQDVLVVLLPTATMRILLPTTAPLFFSDHVQQYVDLDKEQRTFKVFDRDDNVVFEYEEITGALANGLMAPAQIEESGTYEALEDGSSKTSAAKEESQSLVPDRSKKLRSRGPEVERGRQKQSATPAEFKKPLSTSSDQNFKKRRLGSGQTADSFASPERKKGIPVVSIGNSTQKAMPANERYSEDPNVTPPAKGQRSTSSTPLRRKASGSHTTPKGAIIPVPKRTPRARSTTRRPWQKSQCYRTPSDGSPSKASPSTTNARAVFTTPGNGASYPSGSYYGSSQGFHGPFRVPGTQPLTTPYRGMANYKPTAQGSGNRGLASTNKVEADEEIPCVPTRPTGSPTPTGTASRRNAATLKTARSSLEKVPARNGEGTGARGENVRACNDKKQSKEEGEAPSWVLRVPRQYPTSSFTTMDEFVATRRSNEASTDYYRHGDNWSDDVEGTESENTEIGSREKLHLRQRDVATTPKTVYISSDSDEGPAPTSSRRRKHKKNDDPPACKEREQGHHAVLAFIESHSGKKKRTKRPAAPAASSLTAGGAAFKGDQDTVSKKRPGRRGSNP